MKRIKETFVNLIEINKSKFYGILIPINNVDEVKTQLSNIRKEYPKATHYCYAYRIDNLEKSNDDGEPSGTAGRPMLEYLKNNDLDNVLAIVVRYFGGIKLGAGGLVRAYVDSLRNVYSICELYEVTYQSVYSLIVNYSLYDILKNYLNKEEGFIMDTIFSQEVEIIFSSSSFDETKYINLTNNLIKITFKGKQLVYKKIVK